MYLFIKNFLMWTIFKVFIEFVTVLLLFYVLVLWTQDTWDISSFSLSCIGEGNGSPLQCSCPENPRDGGAWWAAVYGVAQSRTRLKWLSSSSSSSSTGDWTFTPYLGRQSLNHWTAGKVHFNVAPKWCFKKNLLVCSLFISLYYFPGIQQSESVIHTYIHIYISPLCFRLFFLYRPLQSIE